jgi:hypothetical protein
MKPSLVEQMAQQTLNLVTIIDGFKDQPADPLMSGLIVFERRLSEALKQSHAELSDKSRPAALSAAINSCMPHAKRFGADNLRAVANNAIEALDELDASNAPLGGEAATHLSIWLSIAAQTRVAVKLTFQMSLLHGRAPNGAPLDPDDIEDPFDN